MKRRFFEANKTGWINQVLPAHLPGQAENGFFKAPRVFVWIQTAGGPHHDRQGQNLLMTQGIQIPIKVIPGRLDHPPALGSVGNLVEVTFQNLFF